MMTTLLIELEGEYDELYKKILKNFDTAKHGTDEINKRVFVQGMLEASDTINKIVSKRDTDKTKDLPLEDAYRHLKIQDPQNGKWYTVGS